MMLFPMRPCELARTVNGGSRRGPCGPRRGWQSPAREPVLRWGGGRSAELARCACMTIRRGRKGRRERSAEERRNSSFSIVRVAIDGGLLGGVIHLSWPTCHNSQR